jgi:integrase
MLGHYTFEDGVEAADEAFSKSGLKTLSQAGLRMARAARAEEKLGEITCSDGVAADQSELTLNWKHILENAAKELTADVLEDYRRRLHTIPVRNVLVGAALLDQLGPRPPPIAAPKLVDNWNRDAHRMLRIGLFWGGLTFGQVSKLATDQYWKACAAISVTMREEGRRGFSYTTVKTDLEWVQRAVRDYARDNNLAFAPVLDIPTDIVRRDIYLTQSEAARLLWACRGRVWNPETNDWVKVVGPEGLVNLIDRSTRDHSRGIARAIIIGLYTGWRHENMARATWKRHPNHGWIDVESGTVYRSGSRQARTNKNQNPSSRALRRLVQHCRRWKKSDDREGHVFIIRKRDGKPYAKINGSFNKIVEAAGLEPEIVVHSFRHTLATWCAFLGIDKDSAAKLLGMSPQTLDWVYKHFSPASEDNAIEIFADAKRRAKLRTLTREKNPDGPKLASNHAPVQAPPRRAVPLKRVARARIADAGRPT